MLQISTICITQQEYGVIHTEILIILAKKRNTVNKKLDPPLCHNIASQLLIKINLYQLIRELRNRFK